MTAEERSLLEQAKKQKNMLIVYRDEISGAYYAGIPVMLSRELLVLAKERDFALDGYVAVALRDITMLEQYDDNDFCRRALEGEGVYQKAAVPALRSAENWKTLLEGIKSAFGGWVSVECENGDDSLLFIGKIASLDERYLYLNRVDADGSWHKKPEAVAYDEMTLISFGGDYLRVFQKYCKAPR